MHMVNVYLLIAVGLLGLVTGSFAGAQVWRLRARQLRDDRKEGYDVDKHEFKKLAPLVAISFKKDRSRCLSCGHELKPKDLIPVISWISTKGKCRYCKHSIGVFEPLIEIATAVLFVLLYVSFSQFSIGLGDWEIIAWLIATTALIILFVYDLKWFLLPDRIVFPLIGLGVLIAGVRIAISADPLAATYDTLASIGVLSGIYFLLYAYSRYKNGEDRTWVGFGDVKLNLALGLLLGSWQLAFLTIFLANLIGVLVILPALVTKKLTMKTQIPFGPLLILGFIISLFYGNFIIEWYIGFNAGLSAIMIMLML